MAEEYVPPEPNKEGFNCPHCQAFAQHKWSSVYSINPDNDPIGLKSRCVKCGGYTVWINEKLYYPKAANAPKAHDSMPKDVRRDFDEARLIVADSSRAAAALLRLAIERLVNNHLDAEGHTLNEKIGNLVEEGSVSSRIQKALDTVRVIGNNSVHPGEMDMDDDQEIATALFKITNTIVDETIAREEQIDEVYELLPEGPKQGIEDRDNN